MMQDSVPFRGKSDGQPQWAPFGSSPRNEAPLWGEGWHSGLDNAMLKQKERSARRLMPGPAPVEKSVSNEPSSLLLAGICPLGNQLQSSHVGPGMIRQGEGAGSWHSASPFYSSEVMQPSFERADARHSSRPGIAPKRHDGNIPRMPPAREWEAIDLRISGIQRLKHGQASSDICFDYLRDKCFRRECRFRHEKPERSDQHHLPNTKLGPPRQICELDAQEEDVHHMRLRNSIQGRRPPLDCPTSRPGARVAIGGTLAGHPSGSIEPQLGRGFAEKMTPEPLVQPNNRASSLRDFGNVPQVAPMEVSARLASDLHPSQRLQAGEGTAAIATHGAVSGTLDRSNGRPTHLPSMTQAPSVLAEGTQQSSVQPIDPDLARILKLLCESASHNREEPISTNHEHLHAGDSVIAPSQTDTTETVNLANKIKGVSPAPPPRREVCRNFKMGRCYRGDRCPHQHDVSAYSPPAAQSNIDRA
ncbi:hypothetical protein OE88DRAFT_776556 [Heliocybe sulcata]|uniref:C3H1-type domain-containing protein n=1 Tax=Heliocybe sulcata TaxID=5364 RepID=A0A5C3MRM5_9AGAM|nr:hypothetical protein OE88DRAFT_776556 [Heliocybe sulcata]